MSAKVVASVVVMVEAQQVVVVVVEVAGEVAPTVDKPEKAEVKRSEQQSRKLLLREANLDSLHFGIVVLVVGSSRRARDNPRRKRKMGLTSEKSRYYLLNVILLKRHSTVCERVTSSK